MGMSRLCPYSFLGSHEARKEVPDVLVHVRDVVPDGRDMKDEVNCKDPASFCPHLRGNPAVISWDMSFSGFCAPGRSVTCTQDASVGLCDNGERGNDNACLKTHSVIPLVPSMHVWMFSSNFVALWTSGVFRTSALHGLAAAFRPPPATHYSDNGQPARDPPSIQEPSTPTSIFLI